MRRKIEGALPKVGAGEFGERVGEEGVGLWFRERERERERSDGGEESRQRTPSGSVSGKERDREGQEEGRLVALKMTDRSLCDRDDRTRVSFVREVEVLKVCSLARLLDDA